MNIVTVGGGFLDIDGLAAGVAYAELLNLQGKPAQFVSTSRMNASVTPTIKRWDLPIQTAYNVNNDDRYIVVDNSSPEWLERFVREDKIDEIVDHHLGHEAYWQERGVTTDIQFIGAASTLIYERWEKTGKRNETSQLSARLLMCGILDNTLDFKASVTTERDKKAYASLEKRAELGDGWPAQYFEECQQGIEDNLEESLRDDTKKGVHYPGHSSAVTISQLVVWDGRRLAAKKDELLELTKLYGEERSVHIVSISEGKNYFLTTSTSLQQFYEQRLGVHYNGDVAVSDRLWLRKEIMKEAIEYGHK